MPLPLIPLRSFKKGLKALSSELRQEAKSLIGDIQANDGVCPCNVDTGQAHYSYNRIKVSLIICKPTPHWRMCYCVYDSKIILVHIGSRENYYQKFEIAKSALGKILDSFSPKIRKTKK